MTQSLSTVIDVYGPDYYPYADDTELSKSGSPVQLATVRSDSEASTDGLVSWVTSHRLKHNPSIAFRHLLPNSATTGYVTEGALFISATTGYVTEGALFISAQLSSDAVSAVRKVPVLI